MESLIIIIRTENEWKILNNDIIKITIKINNKLIVLEFFIEKII